MPRRCTYVGETLLTDVLDGGGRGAGALEFDDPEYKEDADPVLRRLLDSSECPKDEGGSG